MDERGIIEIHVSGNKGSTPLSPDSYDIREIAAMFEVLENMVFPNNKKGRPDITYSIAEGSVRHIFKTSFQTVLTFTAILVSLSDPKSIDKLDLPTARAIERLQLEARAKNYSFEFSTSQHEGVLLQITPETNFKRSDEVWVDAEVYLYGTLTDAGGKEKSNIHLDTKDFGLVKIDADKDYLRNQKENLLYKEFGVRASGRQSVLTGEIDFSSLKLLDIRGYKPVFDKEYLNGLIAKASESWKGVDVDKFMSEIRDYEE